MNLEIGRHSVEPWNPLGAMNIRTRRSLALPTEISSWARCMRKSERRLHERRLPNKSLCFTGFFINLDS
jgi:hypothetical protein